MRRPLSCHLSTLIGNQRPRTAPSARASDAPAATSKILRLARSTSALMFVAADALLKVREAPGWSRSTCLS